METTYVYPSPISPCHIVESETIPVLFLSYIGNYETYSTVNFETYTWDYLYEYAKENFLLPDKEDYWGIAYDDTDITSSEKCRFYACMTIQKKQDSTLPYQPNKVYGVTPKHICSLYPSRRLCIARCFYETILKQLPQSYCLGETQF